jgi:hypothetical protein
MNTYVIRVELNYNIRLKNKTVLFLIKLNKLKQKKTYIDLSNAYLEKKSAKNRQ